MLSDEPKLKNVQPVQSNVEGYTVFVEHYMIVLL